MPEDAGPSTRRRVVRWAAWLTVTGVSLYLVAPSIIQVVASWERLADIKAAVAGGHAAPAGREPGLPVGAAASGHAPPRWFSIITSQLAGNAFARVVPGGGAAGAALQYRMLVNAGVPGGRGGGRAHGLSLLVYAMLLACRCSRCRRSCAATRAGCGRGVGRLRHLRRALRAGHRAAGLRPAAVPPGRRDPGSRNRRGQRRPPPGGAARAACWCRARPDPGIVLGRQWWEALLATVGRWAFDYATLLTALAAVGAHPSPPLVLLAFCAASLLTLVPVTPGGLGFVEAGLTATLALAGVSPGRRCSPRSPTGSCRTGCRCRPAWPARSCTPPPLRRRGRGGGPAVTLVPSGAPTTLLPPRTGVEPPPRRIPPPPRCARAGAAPARAPRGDYARDMPPLAGRPQAWPLRPPPRRLTLERAAGFTWRSLVVLAGVAVLVWLLLRLRIVLLPLLLALMISTILVPWWLEAQARPVPRARGARRGAARLPRGRRGPRDRHPRLRQPGRGAGRRDHRRGRRHRAWASDRAVRPRGAAGRRPAGRRRPRVSGGAAQERRQLRRADRRCRCSRRRC